jgi:adenylate cyclase
VRFAREPLPGDKDLGDDPALRAGLHLGRPSRIGGDYLGVDVNVAARVAEAAHGGEVLVSQTACERLEPDTFELKKLRRFKAKGRPGDLIVYSVKVAQQRGRIRER